MGVTLLVSYMLVISKAPVISSDLMHHHEDKHISHILGLVIYIL